jgi:hypothetical protein
MSGTSGLPLWIPRLLPQSSGKWTIKSFAGGIIQCYEWGTICICDQLCLSFSTEKIDKLINLIIIKNWLYWKTNARHAERLFTTNYTIKESGSRIYKETADQQEKCNNLPGIF